MNKVYYYISDKKDYLLIYDGIIDENGYVEITDIIARAVVDFADIRELSGLYFPSGTMSLENVGKELIRFVFDNLYVAEGTMKFIDMNFDSI